MTPNPSRVFASPKTPNSLSNKVLLSKNVEAKSKIITGTYLDYSIKIPETWSSYVSSEFERSASKQIVEKINFYYNPRNKFNKPILFLSLYVFNRSDYYNQNNSAYTLISQNNSYVFASTTVVTNPFSKGEDRNTFSMLINNSKDVKFLKSIIVLPSEIKESNTITVNNKRLNGKVLVKSGNICFFPLKEICEALGYNVSWNSKKACVIITDKRNTYYKEFFPNQPSKNSGYSVIISNNYSYVNSFYFIWDLGVNFEIDDDYNALITS